MTDAHPPAHHAPKETNKTAEMISNVLAIAGFAILIVIVLWGLFHIVTLSSGWFSSLGGSSKNGMTMSAPSTALSGQPVRVTWKYSSTDAGRFAFLYACTDGLEFGIPVVKDGETTVSLARVPCGATFTLGNATSSVIVVPILSTTTPANAQISMLFVPSTGATPVNASVTMMVSPNTAAKPTVTKTTEKPATKPTPIPTPASGPADLSVQILSATTDSSGMSIVTFDIANTGNSTSGTYEFTAQLPTSQPYSYHSDPQAPLAPGSHIVNTLRFSQSVNGTFTVIVDSYNNVNESNETNNVASREMLMPYVNYNSYNTPYQNTYYTNYDPYQSYQYQY